MWNQNTEEVTASGIPNTLVNYFYRNVLILEGETRVYQSIPEYTRVFISRPLLKV